MCKTQGLKGEMQPIEINKAFMGFPCCNLRVFMER